MISFQLPNREVELVDLHRRIRTMPRRPQIITSRLALRRHQWNVFQVSYTAPGPGGFSVIQLLIRLGTTV